MTFMSQDEEFKKVCDRVDTAVAEAVAAKADAVAARADAQAAKAEAAASAVVAHTSERMREDLMNRMCRHCQFRLDLV